MKNRWFLATEAIAVSTEKAARRRYAAEAAAASSVLAIASTSRECVKKIGRILEVTTRHDASAGGGGGGACAVRVQRAAQARSRVAAHESTFDDRSSRRCNHPSTHPPIRPAVRPFDDSILAQIRGKEEAGAETKLEGKLLRRD